MLRAALIALPLALILAGAPAAAVEPQAPTSGLRENDDGTCGVRLVLKNPDLQANLQNRIAASGWFFIQFQAVGDGADRVASFTFSFGKPIPDALQSCSTPRWVTGLYLQDYRGDYSPEDGFFVPINTTLVPDGEYAAAVHAYDQAGTEIGRFFLTADVDNDCQSFGCRDRTAEQVRVKDRVMPWPRVLPGDGVQTNDVEGLTVEFAEPVTDVHAYLNGNETPLEEWEGAPMDDDAQPGNDEEPCPVQAQYACLKRVWGPAFKWEGQIVQNDVIRVTATDLNENRVEKILHLLDPTQGGIVSGDVVEIDISVDRTTVSVGPGQTGQYGFAFVSLSQVEAHVNLPVQFDERSLTARFSPDHVVVGPGERRTADLLVTPKEGVESGTFLLNAKPTWRSEGQDVSKEFPLSFIVGSGEGGNLVGNQSGDPNATAAEGTDGGGGAPGPGFVAALGVAVAAALFVRARRK